MGSIETCSQSATSLFALFLLHISPQLQIMSDKTDDCLSRCIVPEVGSMGTVEEGKKKAAYLAVDNHVKKDQVIGVGSGSTIVYAVERLKQRNIDEGLNVRCVPTSFQARQLILDAGLNLTDLERETQIDVTIDGCDESDDNLTLIKGGGGCLTQEKIVAAFSKSFIVIADERKNSKQLGEQWKYVPIEVLPFAWTQVKRKIEEDLGGEAKLRMAKAKAGPVVTDNANFLLDWYWGDREMDWQTINTKIVLIPGVLETGLFVKMANKAYFGFADGVAEQFRVDG